MITRKTGKGKQTVFDKLNGSPTEALVPQRDRLVVGVAGWAAAGD
jgi:hypothetical protein